MEKNAKRGVGKLMNYSLKFVCATAEYTTYQKHIPAPYIRKSFVLDQIPVSSEIVLSGLGFYDLYLNGKKITKGYLAPYISNSDDVVYYDKYDIKALLKTGENVIGILLGNGMQNCPGGEIWEFDTARFRSAPKVALTFEAEFDDQSKLTFEADESFRCAPSPIWFDDLRSGVFYDATKEQKGWNECGFDDSTWKPVMKAETPRGDTVLCEADPVVKTKEIGPVSIRKSKFATYNSGRQNIAVIKTEYAPPQNEEGYLYDFGVNMAGIPCLKIKGEKGQKVVLQFGEYIDSNNELSVMNLGFFPHGYVQRDIYICSGEGEEIFVPPFTYHGFQYCLVIGITEEMATKELLTAYVINSDLSERGNFACSDEIATKLQECTRRSDLSNFVYFPTDCPHREKNGWTGDAAVSCEHMTLNLSVEKSYREWLRNIRKAQTEDGRLPGIVPTTGWGFAWGNGPAWDQALVQLPYQTYIFRGETAMIEENATAFVRYVNYIDGRRDKNGLVAVGLGDWCHAGRESGNPKAPLVFTDSVIAIDICEKAAFLLNVIGKQTQSAFAKRVGDELRSAVRERLIDFSTMTAIGSCQTTQAMAIYYNIFTEGEKQAAFAKLLSLVHQYDDHFDVGMLGVRVLFHVLSQFGEDDLAYKLICREDYPSYGVWIKREATTLYEDFNDDTKRERPNSLNHHFMGDISNWFISKVAGIVVNPHRINPAEVNIKPAFLEKLSFAKAHYDTVKGKVSVHWIKSDNTATLEITAPNGVCGSIILPDGWVFAASEGGIRETSVTHIRTKKFDLKRSY